MTTRDTRYIEARPEIVWAVTEDVERWPEWTPTVSSVERVDRGPFRLGSAARIKQPAQGAAEWTVVEFEHGVRFAWESRRRGLRMVGSHELTPHGTGTISVLGVEASGPVAVLMWPILWPATRLAIWRENRGLKARCEGIAARH